MSAPYLISINYSIYTSIRMLIGVYSTMYLMANGVDLKTIAFLTAIFTGTIAITEIPLSVFADQYSRKLSVALGMAATVIFYGFCLFPESFINLCFAYFFYGLAGSFISGALEGLIVDNIETNDKYPYYSHLVAKLSSIGSFIAGLSSYFLYEYFHNLKLLYVVSLVISLLNMLFFLSIKVKSTKAKEKRYNTKHFLEEFKTAFSKLIKSKNISFYLSLAAIYTTLMQIVFYYWQPVMAYKLNDFSKILIFCYLGVFIFQFITNYILSKLKSYPYFKSQITLYILSCGFIYAVILFKNAEIQVVSVIFYVMMMGVITTLPILLQNKFISSNRELNHCISTCLSIISSFSRCVAMLLLITVYLFWDNANPVKLFYIPMGLLFINLLIHFIWKNRAGEYMITATH